MFQESLRDPGSRSSSSFGFLFSNPAWWITEASDHRLIHVIPVSWNNGADLDWSRRYEIAPERRAPGSGVTSNDQLAVGRRSFKGPGGKSPFTYELFRAKLDSYLASLGTPDPSSPDREPPHKVRTELDDLQHIEGKAIFLFVRNGKASIRNA